MPPAAENQFCFNANFEFNSKQSLNPIILPVDKKIPFDNSLCRNREICEADTPVQHPFYSYKTTPRDEQLNISPL